MDTENPEVSSKEMNVRIVLVVQSFGHEKEYLRAIFSVWSFYAHVSADFNQSKTLLYTDNPDFFKGFFDDLNVEFVTLTPVRMKEMRGEKDFLHRMKISIIEEVFRRAEGNVFYVDADSFFVDDPSGFFLKLNERVSFMHSDEYPFCELRQIPLPSGAPSHHVLKYLEEAELTDAEGNTLKISSSLFSWNAGALLLHPKHQFLLPDVYAITDQLYAATGNHASEQYAFSIILQTKTQLLNCDGAVYHYWYRIKKRIMDDYLIIRINATWRAYSRAKKEAQVLKWTKMLPGYLKNHPLALWDRAIQSFNRNEFANGYFWAIKSLVKSPLYISFIRDVAYHTRRLFWGK